MLLSILYTVLNLIELRGLCAYDLSRGAWWSGNRHSPPTPQASNHIHRLLTAGFIPQVSHRRLHAAGFTPQASHGRLHTAGFTPQALHRRLHTAGFTPQASHRSEEDPHPPTSGYAPLF